MTDAAVADENRKRINIAVILTLLYTVPVIPIVLYIYVNAAEVVERSPFYSLITKYFTVDDMIRIMKLAIIATLIGSAIGIVSAVLALKRRLWTVTVTLCLISAIVGIFSFAGLIMGLVALWLLMKAKPAFTD
jgi:hypothetical protein